MSDLDYRPSVLIADSNKEILELFRINLERYKCKMFYARSYNDAMNLLDLRKIDLIVTDLYLDSPSQMGLQFATNAKKIDKNIQIIIIAQEPDTESIKEAVQIDVYDYLQKPIQIPAIARASTRAIEKRLLLDERDQLKSYVDEINRKLEISNRRYKKFTEELRSGQFAVEEELTKGIDRLKKELKTIQGSGIDENDK